MLTDPTTSTCPSAPDPVQSLICSLTSLSKSLSPPGNHKKETWTDMYTSSDTRWEWSGEGPLFTSYSNKHRRAKIGPLFESLPGPLLKSGLQPLDRYGTHQETISRRPELMCTWSDTRLEWPREGPLFQSDSNKRQGQKRGHYLNHLSGHYWSQAFSPWTDMAPTKKP